MPVKILIVAYWHDPRFKKKPGGLIRIYELADNLTAMGHHVTMVLPNLGFPQTQTRAHVVTIPFLDFPILRPFSFHLISTIYIFCICLKKMDRIYVRQMNSFLPLMIANIFGIFSYFEIPNDPYIGYSLIGKSKRWLVKIIDQICMNLADQNVVLSHWSKNRLNTIGGISLSKIIVFPSGTDTDLFHPMEKEIACQNLGLDLYNKYVGFIGSFLEYQGIDTIIEAAPMILAESPISKFLLVGDGPMRTAWEMKIQEKGLQDHFIITGHIPYRDVPTYLGAMDVCVAPHHKDTNQASPVKLFDYMAAGRPIVASDIDVVREIIGNSGCALLTAPNCPDEFARNIATLLSNEALRKEMAENGRMYAVKEYDRKILTEHLFAHQ